MPDRILRASVIDSPSLARCSFMAYGLWPYLMTMADHAGRFEADATSVRLWVAKRRTDVTDDDVESVLREYEREGMISRWTYKEHTYGEFANWSRHNKPWKQKSRIPGPGGVMEKPSEDTDTTSKRLPKEVVDAINETWITGAPAEVRKQCVRWLFEQAEPHTISDLVYAMAELRKLPSRRGTGLKFVQSILTRLGLERRAKTLQPAVASNVIPLLPFDDE